MNPPQSTSLLPQWEQLAVRGVEVEILRITLRRQDWDIFLLSITFPQTTKTSCTTNREVLGGILPEHLVVVAVEVVVVGMGEMQRLPML